MPCKSNSNNYHHASCDTKRTHGWTAMRFAWERRFHFFTANSYEIISLYANLIAIAKSFSTRAAYDNIMESVLLCPPLNGRGSFHRYLRHRDGGPQQEDLHHAGVKHGLLGLPRAPHGSRLAGSSLEADGARHHHPLPLLLLVLVVSSFNVSYFLSINKYNISSSCNWKKLLISCPRPISNRTKSCKRWGEISRIIPSSERI